MTNKLFEDDQDDEKRKRCVEEWRKRRGDSMTKVIEDMLEEHRRIAFFEELDKGYKALNSDSAALAEEAEEDRLWDSTLIDGLEDE